MSTAVSDEFQSVAVKFIDKVQPLFEPHRYKVGVGGRGGVKSWSFARALLIKASQQPLRILCGRQIQNSLEESVHHLLESQIPLLGLQDHYEVLHNKIVGKYHASEFIYTGLAKHTKQSIKSYEDIDIFWGEEAVDFSKASWDILLPTIRKPGSEIWITFNPELDTDETYIRFVVNPPEDTVVMHLSWEDNPWFSRELEMERRACLARSKEDYDNIWMGRPRTTLPGSVYGREVSDLIRHGRYAPLPYDSRLKAHTIWDMGWNGACTIHIVQTQMSALRIIGYLEGRFVRIDEWAALLNAMPLNWGWDWLPHDGYVGERKTGLSDYDILKRNGRHVRGYGNSIPLPAEVNVENGMKMLRHAFPLIYVHKGPSDFIPKAYTDPNQELMPGLTYHTTERLVECWKRFKYNVPKHGEPQAPVPDEYMHACDGSRYLAITAPKLTNEDEWSDKPIPGISLGRVHDRGMGQLG